MSELDRTIRRDDILWEELGRTISVKASPIAPEPAPVVIKGGVWDGGPAEVSQALLLDRPKVSAIGKNAVVGTAGFFGALLLMLVPVVNIAALVCWACGRCKKLSLRNFARAMLLFLAVCLLIAFAGAVYWDVVAAFTGNALAAVGVDIAAVTQAVNNFFGWLSGIRL